MSHATPPGGPSPPLPLTLSAPPLYTDSGTFLSPRLSPVDEGAVAAAAASSAPSYGVSSSSSTAAPAGEAFVSLWPASQGDAAIEQAKLQHDLQHEDDEQHESDPSIPAAQVPPLEMMDFELPPSTEDEEEEEEEEEAEEKEHEELHPSAADERMEAQSHRAQPQRFVPPQLPPERPASPLRASVSALRSAALTTGSSATAAAASSSSSAASSLTVAASTAAYATCLRTLVHAVDNVLEHPRVEKFRLLPLGNAKFRAKISGAGTGSEGNVRMLERASLLLQRLGWTLVEGGADAGFLLLTDEFRDEATLKHAKSLLEHELVTAQEMQGGAPAAAAATASQPVGAASGRAAPVFVPAAPVAAPPRVAAPVAFPAAAPASVSSNLSSLDSVLSQPLSALKKAYKRKDAGPARPTPTRKLTREQMAARVAERLSGGSGGHNAAAPNGAAASAPIAGKIMDLSHNAALRAQLASVRRDQHNKWVRGAQERKRVYTVADLATMEEADIKARAALGAAPSSGAAAAGGGGSRFKALADFGTGTPQDCLKLGQEMLRLSNEFRAREGKRALAWHPKLHEIALVHSKNMAVKSVPFGHQGAKARFAAYPFHAQSAAENVAWSQGVPEVAKCHVDGWINSPGHRKNLLAHHNWCAIAVFRNNDGAYYSTQLFGLG